ncbi:hypothetical protein E4T42_05161 [Aureobasidium subglaciale]|nr:hypothetical protein E4T42_05161 [Aureobasidium subglaciale]
MTSSFFKCLYHAYVDLGILANNTYIDPEIQASPSFETVHGLPRKVYPAPFLETFHDQMFCECDEDGKPLWCRRCEHYKPIRTHHSRMLDRCVSKFDHYCSWVGGYTTATNFKFFLQFSVPAA